MTFDTLLLHGTCVALGKNAALIRGESGAGKSDFAFRFINLISVHDHEATHLVADDQVNVTRIEDQIRVAPPATIAGKLELRGIGIIEVPYLIEARLRLIVDLKPSNQISRLPDWTTTHEILGLHLPGIELAPFEASAPLKLRAAFARVDQID